MLSYNLGTQRGKRNTLERRLGEVVQQIQDYESGLTPSGTTDVASLYKQREQIERILEAFDNRINSIKSKLTQSHPYEDTTPLAKEVASADRVPYESVQQVLDIFPEKHPYQHIEAFMDNPQLFNQKGNVFFDKMFGSDPFGKTAQKIIEHFLKVVGLDNDKIYFVFDNKDTSSGSVMYSGNTAIVRINRERFAPSVNAMAKWKSISTMGSIGKNLDNALNTFAAVS